MIYDQKAMVRTLNDALKAGKCPGLEVFGYLGTVHKITTPTRTIQRHTHNFNAFRWHTFSIEKNGHKVATIPGEGAGAINGTSRGKWVEDKRPEAWGRLLALVCSEYGLSIARN